jgi:hypothetical protein
MQGIGEAIKYFYQQFILRDVLAYVTSGAILAGCVLFLRYGDLATLVGILKDVPFVAAIPIFGILFMIGFGLQNLGEMTQLLKWHNREKDGKRDDKRHLEILQNFHHFSANTNTPDTSDTGWLERTRERIEVKKFTSGNGALAIGISVILAGIAKWQPGLLGLAELALSLLLILALLRGHRNQREIGQAWEDLVIPQVDDNSSEPLL